MKRLLALLSAFLFAGLAGARTFPLRSSFSPEYNMAVNLLEQLGRPAAREVLETSFAQFQADRAVVGLAAQIRRNEEALAGYADAMTCHLGDFSEYAGLRQRLSDREKDLARSGARSVVARWGSPGPTDRRSRGSRSEELARDRPRHRCLGVRRPAAAGRRWRRFHCD